LISNSDPHSLTANPDPPILVNADPDPFLWMNANLDLDPGKTLANIFENQIKCLFFNKNKVRFKKFYAYIIALNMTIYLSFFLGFPLYFSPFCSFWIHIRIPIPNMYPDSGANWMWIQCGSCSGSETLALITHLRALCHFRCSDTRNATLFSTHVAAFPVMHKQKEKTFNIGVIFNLIHYCRGTIKVFERKFGSEPDNSCTKSRNIIWTKTHSTQEKPDENTVIVYSVLEPNIFMLSLWWFLSFS
jgi:hypothetical protein